MSTMIAFAAGLPLVGGSGFFAGWRLRGRRAEAERATWSYALCGSFIGLRGCFDRKDGSLRDYLTEQARMQYRLWRAGRRVNPPPFSPSTDELFRIAEREFSAEAAAPGAGT